MSEPAETEPQWTEVGRALQAIRAIAEDLDDPRQGQAQEFLRSHFLRWSSGSGGGSISGKHRRSGGMHMRTEAEYDGWGDEGHSQRS